MSLFFAFMFACTKAAAPPPENAAPVQLSPAEVASEVKAPGNLPVLTETEQAKEEAKRRACIEECIASRQAEAIAAEMIADQCQQGCIKKIPVRQLEIIPDPGDVQLSE